MKTDTIAAILNKLSHTEIALDCSRYEENYSGYTDARDWYMQYVNKKINLEEYLNGISEDKLEKILKNI